uniref:Uncharacterized protein n=1 Tax=Amphimedon queenslandica TaxID=400682 RepID=A0A1X7T913_AMPQE
MSSRGHGRSNDSKLGEMTQLQELAEEKQIITEDYEKLKTKVVNNDDNQNLKTEISEKEKVIAKLTSQVEEQSQNEKQIITDLRAKVSDNELYIAKLMKEKSQLQERVTSLEEQSIKETSSIGLQFNYLIPSMDKLDCLSSVQVAEKKLFLIQGDKPQLMNWEDYGLRIGVQKESLLSSETVEAAVVALVGGQFQFPPNTVLVSAVYAVSLLKPLLKRLKLEIQHCVDLTGQPGLSRYLKFAIAPMSTPSLPYQFSIVEGGKFSSNSGYGSIERKEFCLVCILGFLIAGDDGEGGGGGQQQQPQGQGAGVVPAQQQQGGGVLTVLVQQQQPGANEQTNGQQGEEGQQEGQQEEEDKSQEGQQQQEEQPQQEESQEGWHKEEGGDYQEGGRGQEEEQQDPVHVETETVSKAVLCTETSIVYTDVRKNMKYAGLIYYREKGVEDLVIFTAAKELEALTQFVERKYSEAEIGPNISFCFKFPYERYIELNFNAYQDEPTTGWIVKPHTKPSRLYQEDIDKFGDKQYCYPSCCLISVYGSPDAVPFLNYSVPLVGVVNPVTLIIHRARRNPPPPSTNPTTSSSNVVHESMSVSSIGGATTVDVKKIKKVINDILQSHYADLTSLPMEAVPELANKLFTLCLINKVVRGNPSIDKIISEFQASLTFQRELSQVQEHCKKFLNSFVEVSGSFAYAAIALHKDWIEAIRNKLENSDFNIVIDE